MNSLIAQINDLLYNRGFFYAFCGGYAMDLFIGRETRIHGDVDIFAYNGERDRIIAYMNSVGYDVYEMLGGGKVHHITDIAEQRIVKRNIFAAKDGCELITLYGTDEKDIYYLDFRHVGQTKPDFIEFLFNDKTVTDLLYARDNSIKRSLSKSVMYRDGVPYLAPEVCLLNKSTDIEREGYEHDFTEAIKAMDAEQKSWLRDALVTAYPNGHKWLERL